MAGVVQGPNRRGSAGLCAQPPLHAEPFRPTRSAVMILLVSLLFLAVFAGIALIAAEAVP